MTDNVKMERVMNNMLLLNGVGSLDRLVRSSVSVEFLFGEIIESPDLAGWQDYYRATVDTGHDVGNIATDVLWVLKLVTGKQNGSLSV